MGKAWLCQHRSLSDTCATYLPLLPAWDVADLQGKLPAMMPVHVLSPVISRVGFQHTWEQECVVAEAQALCSTRRGRQQTGFWSVQKPEQLQLWWLWVFLITTASSSVLFLNLLLAKQSR